MACIDRRRIRGIDRDGIYERWIAAAHPIVHRGPNSAAVCRLEKTVAKCAGVERQRCRWIDGECTNIWSPGYAEVVLDDPGAAAVRTLKHTIARTNIHRRRR